ncbi:F-box only protein 25 isoform X4 [Oopsacas minuta]|uniref:F-box only protein 25 isoform X4 n=1 Tax=Oopsacas minuta TaxID=111878 RepID=A0AAV7KHL2_9METZ|nr:F-box only protein 25 isoform X4 [Oopsacas minuta]
MPFLGHSSSYSGSNKSEKSGGKKWTKTLSGWKPVVGHTSEYKLKETPKVVTPKDSEDRKEQVKKMLESSFVKYSKRRQGTSRESSSYTSIGQAMLQMHFVLATENTKYHPFIIQIIKLLFEESIYPSLSGSAQLHVFNILESLITYVIRTEDNHSSCVICLNDVVYNLKQVSRNSPNLHCKKQAQAQLKKIYNLKAILMQYIENKYTRETSETSSHLSSLPDDCLRQIIILVQNPIEIFNLGRTCRRFWAIVYDSRLWRELLRTYSQTHYTQMMGDYIGKNYHIQNEVTVDTAMQAYRRWYNEVYVKMDQSPRIIQLCTICEFLYWEDSIHPCIYKINHPKTKSSIPINPKEFIDMYL